ncbi:hypothetical protein IscW_ISCW016181 [Ixodes scapularis]|uniref:Uncharacterized protein n=1 Tax=Ixodes scapularis TaxID=6945 RepID=B7P365_IXOSC|nr:hypothetical protein IscW_ISCW016181 [Ixodes scapularis]|eukprot:XP_002403624.1 hypothetical protein IscW_ISCW016181 [Ixodes scapularis]
MSVLDELVDDVILGACFEVHRSVKLGIFFLDEAKDETAPVAEPADEVHIDVDTFDESDNHSLHEVIGQMWENVSSTNSSPADSSYQSNNGSVVKKKDKRPFSSSALKKSKTRPGGSGPSSAAGGDHVASDLL